MNCVDLAPYNRRVQQHSLTKDKAEVDFVINYGKGVLPIEAKCRDLREKKIDRPLAHLVGGLYACLLESPIAVPATVRFLQTLGIGTSLSVNWNPSPLLGLKPIFFIQMGILLSGFGLTLYVLYRLLKRFQKPLYHAYKMTVAMSLYAFIIVLSAIYLLGLPMSGRHVH